MVLGGKFYQHIFTDTKRLKNFKEAEINICYDTSHAKLSSNAWKILKILQRYFQI